MAEQLLKAVGIIGATIDPKTRDRTLLLKFSDGSKRRVVFDQGVVGALGVGLLALKDPFQPNAAGEAFQPLHLTAVAGPLSHPKGRIVVLELEGSLHLPIVLSDSAFARLRDALEQFQAPKTSPSTASTH